MALNLLVLVSIIYCTSAYVTVNVYEEGQDTLSQEFSHCEYHDCDNFCKRLGYQSGTCVDGHCKCNHKQADDAIILKECTPATCNQLCRRMGFPGGDCINNRCECEKLVDKLETDSSSLRSCNLRACEQRCRRLGFPGGACVGDRCKCDNFRASEGIADTENNNDVSYDAGEMDVNPLRRCNLWACEQHCRRLGFHGACVGDKCKCDNFRTSKGLDSAKINTEYRSCNYRECDRRCRRLKFPGGACVNNQCKCYNFRQLLSNEESLATNTTDNPLENDVKCDSTQCKTSCSERGLRNGICIEKECYCDMEDAETSSLPCEPHACNDSCQIMNRLGGFCLLGKCICY